MDVKHPESCQYKVPQKVIAVPKEMSGVALPCVKIERTAPRSHRYQGEHRRVICVDKFEGLAQTEQSHNAPYCEHNLSKSCSTSFGE